METTSPLYPNMYTFLVGEAGLGKSRAITAAANLVREAIPEVNMGATSMTRASLVDYMVESKRMLPQLPDPAIEYNSMLVVADELSAFMHEYDSGLVAGLVEFYDVNPYSEGRRVAAIRIKLQRPQLSILAGSTPSNLVHTLKDYVWDQGLMSRVFLVFSTEQPMIDTLSAPQKGKPNHLLHDLKMIFKLQGKFTMTQEFKDAMWHWKLLKLDPAPDHPKLKHYCTRRWAHLLKLSMVASVDRGNSLELTKDDFNTAFGWLIDMESVMPLIFQIGSVAPDSRVMDEVVHFVRHQKNGISEYKVVNFIRQQVPGYSVKVILDNLVAARLIRVIGTDKHGLRVFTTP